MLFQKKNFVSKQHYGGLAKNMHFFSSVFDRSSAVKTFSVNDVIHSSIDFTMQLKLVLVQDIV